jgi:2-amino-4-hydroxy-6-hydroxymethyldihydropteridine diphosphokinase
MFKSIILLGTNQGKREENLFGARKMISEQAGTVAAASSIYETAPWGSSSMNWYLNQAVVVDTRLQPVELLNKVLSIEKELGRERGGHRYEDRIIDIDILFYENWVIDQPALKIPHPRLHERNFVLVPLVELVPDWQHPVLEKTVKELLSELDDNLEVRGYKGGQL